MGYIEPVRIGVIIPPDFPKGLDSIYKYGDPDTKLEFGVYWYAY